MDSEEELLKIQREIGRMNNRTQIQHLMKNRQMLLARVESLKNELAMKLPDFDPVNLRIFQCIYRVLAVYGRGVCESILLSFERESKRQRLEIVNYPKTFYTCIEKVFGEKPSKEIEKTILSTICNEFGLQLSKKSNTADAISLARIRLQRLTETLNLGPSQYHSERY